MKNKKFIIFIIIFVFFFACRKEKIAPSMTIFEVTDQDSGIPIYISSGQKLRISFSDLKDSEYKLNTIVYDQSILKFSENNHIVATSLNILGFIALKSGTSKLSITATRSTDKSTIVIYEADIIVN